MLLGVALAVVAVLVAFASVYARRTQLEQTTAFWGEETIQALQLSSQVTLRLAPEPGTEAAEETLEVTELTGTPGLGHLRHALLDQRHYQWPTRTAAPVRALPAENSRFATLTFSDPFGQFATATIDLELNGGWVGPAAGNQRVQLAARVQPAVRHFLVTINNAQQAHYDQRRGAQKKP